MFIRLGSMKTIRPPQLVGVHRPHRRHQYRAQSGPLTFSQKSHLYLVCSRLYPISVWNSHAPKRSRLWNPSSVTACTYPCTRRRGRDTSALPCAWYYNMQAIMKGGSL